MRENRLSGSMRGCRNRLCRACALLYSAPKLFAKYCRRDWSISSYFLLFPLQRRHPLRPQDLKMV
jgi:hypothetical protein